MCEEHSRCSNRWHVGGDAMARAVTSPGFFIEESWAAVGASFCASANVGSRGAATSQPDRRRLFLVSASPVDAASLELPASSPPSAGASAADAGVAATGSGAVSVKARRFLVVGSAVAAEPDTEAIVG